jgi:AraC family cel operon transcriptional repressor
MILRIEPLLAAGEACHFATVTGDRLSTRQHGHDFCEVFWCIEGRGVETRPEASEPLNIGGYGLVTPETVHGFRSDGGLTFRNLALPVEAWRDLRHRYGHTLHDLFATGEVRDVLQSEQLRHVEQAAEPLRQGRRDRVAMDRLLLVWEQVVTERSKQRLPDWLAEALTLQEELRGGVASWVQRCGYSHEHVTRTCREHLGQSPTQLVNGARLDLACRLLERTDRDVTDICYASGFSNLGHFHKTFRNRHKTTPLRYRRRQRSVLPDETR